MNSILQCLTNLRPFTKKLKTKLLKDSDLSHDSLYRVLFEIIEQLEMASYTVNPKKVKDAIAKNEKTFEGYQQQDAHEFFSSCINQLEEEVVGYLKKQAHLLDIEEEKAITTYCPVNSVFNLEIQHTLSCVTCQHVSHITELYRYLSLDVNIHLNDCLSTQSLLIHFLSVTFVKDLWMIS